MVLAVTVGLVLRWLPFDGFSGVYLQDPKTRTFTTNKAVHLNLLLSEIYTAF
jgi:hypothetical protein